MAVLYSEVGGKTRLAGIGTFVLLADPSESYVFPFVRPCHRPANRGRRCRLVSLPAVGGSALKEGFQVRPADSSATADQNTWQLSSLDVLLHGWPGDVQKPRRFRKSVCTIHAAWRCHTLEM